MFHLTRELLNRDQDRRDVFPKRRGISPDAIDEAIEREERRVMKRRGLCLSCMTYKSVSGSCFC